MHELKHLFEMLQHHLSDWDGILTKKRRRFFQFFMGFIYLSEISRLIWFQGGKFGPKESSSENQQLEGCDIGKMQFFFSPSMPWENFQKGSAMPFFLFPRSPRGRRDSFLRKKMNGLKIKSSKDMLLFFNTSRFWESAVSETFAGFSCEFPQQKTGSFTRMTGHRELRIGGVNPILVSCKIGQ